MPGTLARSCERGRCSMDTQSDWMTVHFSFSSSMAGPTNLWVTYTRGRLVPFIFNHDLECVFNLQNRLNVELDIRIIYVGVVLTY